MYSKLIKNAQIIDGTGKAAFQGDVAIDKDRIAAVGNLKRANAAEIIDAAGKFLSPGFVDIQNHSDVYWTIFDNPRLDSLAAQGITTALIGNCGASLAPLLSRDALLAVQKWHNLEGVNFNWLSFGEYLDELGKHKFGVNIASLVGYSTLRRGLLKDDIRALKEAEHKILQKALKNSLEAGAFGMSSGLSYAHEAIISESELIDLAKTVKDYKALFSIHLRSESGELTESVAEALRLSNQTGVNLKISHFKVRNKINWHLLPDALALIEAAAEKAPVHFDLYPYDFVWQVLYTYLPSWTYEGGREVMLKYLKDPEQRKKILAYLSGKDIDYSQIFITSTTMPLNVVGKNLAEIGRNHNISAEEALLTVVENGGSQILVFDRNLSEPQVKELMAHPLAIIATDGAGFPADHSSNLVHPRCFGAMPKYLSWVFAENLPIEKAIQKITSMPAQKIGLRNRGKIQSDYYADLVIFNSAVKTGANYVNPYQLPEGIEHVFVNGQAVVEKSAVVDNLNGRILRRY